jgi:hypothetical protein
VRVNVDLQEDFSMDHALSLYLFETIPLLDAEAETHALDLLTLVESILENPELILRRQLDKLKDRKVAEMKAEGSTTTTAWPSSRRWSTRSPCATSST